MSLFICERHGYRFDTDFIDCCPGCETEEAEDVLSADHDGHAGCCDRGSEGRAWVRGPDAYPVLPA